MPRRNVAERNSCHRRRCARWQEFRYKFDGVSVAARFQSILTGISLAADTWVAGKRFVYVLRNTDPMPRFYVGLTSDVQGRLDDHNAGRCSHTARYRPWQLHVVIEFSDEARAVHFERYLKSGSGRAFAKRRFEQ